MQNTAAEERPVKAANPYAIFLFKTVTVAVVLYFLLTVIIETAVDAVRSAIENTAIADRAISRVLRDEALRLRVRRLATSNPAMHQQAAAYFESQGDIANAVQEMELALGLLELHSAERAVRDRYAKRLQELRAKRAAK